MGCDIHLYVEQKMESKWYSLDIWKQDHENYPFRILEESDWHSRYYHGRDYYLFRSLANVRGVGNLPISKPKGFPEDASKQVFYQFEREGGFENFGDAHSPSWHLLSDLLPYRNQFNEKFQHMLTRLEYINNPVNTRIVFWFDN